MVTQEYPTMHKAIAMIELIFALVIMGITIMAAPMLISTASSSVSVALQQEGINEAASRLGIILTHEWDDNNLRCQDSPSILHTQSPVAALEEVGTTQRRIGSLDSAGNPLSNSHTYDCNGVEYNATAIGREGTTYDDIDDFDGTSKLVEVTLGAGGKDYLEKDTVTISTAVTYGNDSATYSAGSISFIPSTATGGTTSIKQINTTLTSTHAATELQKQITLRAFSCNIGSYNYDSRIMP